MRILEYQKGQIGLSAIWFLLGYPIYEIVEKQDVRMRSFCQGLISSCKSFNYSRGTILKDFLFCGKRISRYGIFQYERIFELFGICFYKKNIWEVFYNQVQHLIPPQTDHIFILSSGLGEIYCFLAYCLKGILKKKQIKHPVFFTTNKGHISLFSMLAPHYEIYYIPPKWVFQNTERGLIHGIECSVLFPAFYFQQIEVNIGIHKSHFLDGMFHFLGLAKNTTPVSIEISPKVVRRIDDILNNLDLKPNNYVFMSIEANSCQPIPLGIWQELVSYINSKGLKVFFNTPQKGIFGDYCSMNLTLEEAFVLASKARYVIGLRSGLMDVLLQGAATMHIIYTDFPARTNFSPMKAEDVFFGFDLKKLLPLNSRKKIYSYIYTEPLIQQLKDNLV